MQSIDFSLIGQVDDTDILHITGLDGNKVISAGIADLKESWQRPLRW